MAVCLSGQHYRRAGYGGGLECAGERIADAACMVDIDNVARAGSIVVGGRSGVACNFTKTDDEPREAVPATDV